MAERNFLPLCYTLTTKTIRSFDQDSLVQKGSRAADLILLGLVYNPN